MKDAARYKMYFLFKGMKNESICFACKSLQEANDNLFMFDNTVHEVQLLDKVTNKLAIRLSPDKPFNSDSFKFTAERVKE